MTAPSAPSGGSTMPWKWRLALAGLALLAIAEAPGPTGDFSANVVHGLGSIGCRLGHVTCVTSADQLNPLTQVSTRVDQGR